jgi:hypothetical protein
MVLPVVLTAPATVRGVLQAHHQHYVAIPKTISNI